MLREDFQVWNELGGKIQTPRLPVCAQDTDAERSRVGFAACNQDDRKHEGRLAVSITLDWLHEAGQWPCIKGSAKEFEALERPHWAVARLGYARPYLTNGHRASDDAAPGATPVKGSACRRGGC
jgi:hypothetical protein